MDFVGDFGVNYILGGNFGSRAQVMIIVMDGKTMAKEQ